MIRPYTLYFKWKIVLGNAVKRHKRNYIALRNAKGPFVDREYLYRRAIEIRMIQAGRRFSQGSRSKISRRKGEIMGRIIRAISDNKTINMIAIDSTDMVEEARKTHKMSPVATAALGRSISAASMMGLMLKEERGKLTLQIKGDGPLGMIVCVANSEGTVKGYLNNPDVDLPIRDSDGKLDVASAVGREGTISVIRDLGLKEPYIGQYPITSGEIAEDLTQYYANSEQVPSSVALGVLIDRNRSVKASGGFIVQLMPDVTTEDIEVLERNLRGVLSVSHMVEEAESLEQIVEVIMGELGFTVIEETHPQYLCDCNKPRIERALVSLGREELTQILEEDGQAELTCHFCNKNYLFSEEDLAQMIEACKR